RGGPGDREGPQGGGGEAREWGRTEGFYECSTSLSPSFLAFRNLYSSAKDVGGSPEKAATDLSSESKKLNKSQQLKKVFEECGAVGVSFHVGISLVSLGIFYLAVSSGVDMTAVLFKLGFSEASLQSKRAAGTSTFVLAYAIYKLFAPV
uniref:DUF1279 domain-containing protein n=1 Tax=Anser brachyrhynchus TaxID=132585 RepID=A0A8B9CIW9_9AVES